MKIIEAMKQVKDLTRKADDLRKKVQEHAADLDVHTPVYEDQTGQVAGWLQAHQDITREILRLKVAIQKTNLQTEVTIELGGKGVTKPIAAWIHRRITLAEMDRKVWESLGHMEKLGKLREGVLQGPTGDSPAREIKVRRYYDPATRDKKVDLYKSEPTTIDGSLEVANAVTDLIE